MKRQIPGGGVRVAGPYGASGYYSIRTHVDEMYGQARERWYRNGRKEIPGDFEPTPDAMLAAYLGDGSLNSGARGGGRLVRLSACAFSREQVERLAEQLQRLGFDAAVHRMRDPYHELVVRAGSVPGFLAWIGPCPVPAYAYKWAVQDYVPDVCGGCGCARDEASRGCASCRTRRWSRKSRMTKPLLPDTARVPMSAEARRQAGRDAQARYRAKRKAGVLRG